MNTPFTLINRGLSFTQSKKKKKLLLSLFILTGIVQFGHTQIIYEEDFTGQNDKGATCACTGAACSTPVI